MSKTIKVAFLIICMTLLLSGCSAKENETYVENKEITLTFSYGERTGTYTGDIQDGIPEGNGTFESINDSEVKWVYTGTWKQGTMDGEGVCEWEDGNKHDGEYKAGLRNGKGKWYENGKFMYSGFWADGKLLSINRNTIKLSNDEPQQYVQMGNIGFQIPKKWIYEVESNNTTFITVPEIENVEIIYSSQEKLDLDKNENRNAIIQTYLNVYGKEYSEYILVSEDYSSGKYNLHFTFYEGDAIADVYSNTVSKNNGTYILTVVHRGIADNYFDAAMCIPSTMKNWDSYLEDIAELEKEKQHQTILQCLAGDVNWETLEQLIPKVIADEIVQHNAPKEQIILVEGIIDNISDESFDLWIPYQSTFYKDTSWNYNTALGEITSGDTVEICIETHSDGSFKKNDGILAIRKLNVQNIPDIVKHFKDTCPKLDYKAIMRNPDNSYGTMGKISGTVLQVVSTESYMQEFLLSLDDGNLVYVSYFKEEQADNVLENDTVSVYGIFYFTETYTTIMGIDKTVPCLTVDYIDIK